MNFPKFRPLEGKEFGLRRPGRTLQSPLLMAALSLWAVSAVLPAFGSSRSLPRPAQDGRIAIVTLDSRDDVGQFTSLALDDQNRPVVSYFKSTTQAAKLVRCGDGSCSTELSKTVLKKGGVGGYTSVALDSNGAPVISFYYGNLDLETGDLRVVHCGNRKCTADNVRATPDSAGFTGIGTSLVLDALGNPVVSYVSLDRGGLKVLHCGDPDCASGNYVTALDPDVYGVQTSIALDASGDPVVAYVAFSGLRILHCGDADCTTGNTYATPDSTGPAGWQGGTSMSLDAAGNPVVGYFYWDYINTELRILHCGTPGCEAGNSFASPDPTAVAGGGSSLRVDSTGLPVVSYAGQGGSALSILHCGDAICASGNTIATPDTADSPGFYSSLRLTPNDTPVVSYYASGAADLRIVKCGTATCT